MLSTRPRRSTSAVSYPDAAEATELQGHLDALRAKLAGNGATPSSQLVQEILESVQIVRQAITQNANPGRMRDAFRNLKGFSAIFDLLRFISAQLCIPNLVPDDIILRLDLLHCTLALLSGNLQEHWGNKKYFRTRVEEGGWISMRSVIKELLGAYWAVRQNSENARERVFGYLVSCALDDDSSSEIFLKLERENRSHKELSPALLLASESIINNAIGPRPSLRSPEALVVLLELWNDSRTAEGRPFDNATIFSPTLIRLVAESSTHNLASLHGAGLLQESLPLLLDQSLHPTLQGELKKMAVSLLKLGVADVRDAKLLYRNASNSEPVAETLRIALKDSYSPPYIHFDLSLRGYACVELPDIGRTFPPVSSSSGYTLSVWLEIVQFDPNSHTTIFGAFDSSQSCFVLVYLEKDTRHLILQTSVTSSRPSVRFKSFTFEPARWYHLCIVHKRPRPTSSSRASLFIDGEFVEQVKAHYPSSPPNPAQTTNGATSSTNQRRAIQTFLGTPQDLATRLGEGVVSLQWRLGSACLFGDTLSDDLIAVHKELGPRYHGNYQDCLGSFQTYQASAALNLRNENLHPGKEEKSDIVAAIRSKASSLLPEFRFLLNISPMMVLDDDDRNNVNETQLVKALSKPAAKRLKENTRGGRAALAVNGAIPSINEALLQPYGFGILTGTPVVVVPQSLDDASWRIGGCGPVALSLVDAAETKSEILRSLEILFGTVINSWRNSEAMERENGFGVLSNLLSAKLGNFSSGIRSQNPSANSLEAQQESIFYDVLIMILKFVGYQTSNPEDSVINNPLAYRILLVDLDIWRSSSPRVQHLYYEQFVTFGSGSKHHVFNAKRLSRMRITKKWLEALKGDIFYSDTIDDFLFAFRSLLSTTVTAETLRSLALFVTFAIHKATDRTPFLRPSKSVKKAGGGGIVRRSTTPLANPESEAMSQGSFRTLSRLEVGARVLDLYADLLCGGDVSIVRKFAKTVTNKWLLHLLSDSDPAIIILATRILSRLLVIIGPSYVEKFADKTGGWIIMRHRLRKWWNRTELWPLCFAILFGRDVATIDHKRPLDLYTLIEYFPPAQVKMVHPGVLPVIVAMLQNGLKSVVQGQEDPSSPIKSNNKGAEPANSLLEQLQQGTRARAQSLQDQSISKSTGKKGPDALLESIKTIQTVTRFLGDMHSNSQKFRDFAVDALFVQEFLFVLFPIVVSADVVSPETELHSRDSSLTFNGDDVVIRPLSQTPNKAAPIVRTATVEGSLTSSISRTQPLKRGSSFVLITSEESHFKPSSARLETVASPKGKSKMSNTGSHALVEDMLEMVIAVFSDQIFSRKDFQGIGLFMKVPPGFQEHQAYFETFILRNTISSIGNAIKLKQKLLWEPRVLTNLSRFCSHLDEAVYEGWFIDGADIVLDFIGEILEYLQRPDIQQMKSIRLCSEIIAGMRTVVSRIALLRLSEYDDSPEETKTVGFLKKLTYWQMVLFAQDSARDESLRLICYLLYTKLVSAQEHVRNAAADLWRIFLVQKPTEVAGVLHRIVNAEDKSLSKGFQKILELDNSSFLGWVDDHRIELDAVFFGKLASTWESFVATENRLTEEAFRARVAKRQEKLRIWINDDMVKEDVIRRHEINSDHWRSNIYTSEHLKRQRALQDQQDGHAFNTSSWERMSRQLHRPCGLLDDGDPQKWQLDLTEGRNRMRLRIIPDYDGHLYQYQSKVASTKAPKNGQLALDLRSKGLKEANPGIAPSPTTEAFKDGCVKAAKEPDNDPTDPAETEDDFEIVEELEIESFEDKNRKVMRSLQRGDQVEHVHNISRIVGLEACEGLLIIGKVALYLLDSFFQRSDGEIVDAWQAPLDERDSYLQMISGRPAGSNTAKPADVNHETRSWRWEDILSISKRRFLFRDVAIEVFFVDGQSYLLTIATPKTRDELYQRLLAKSQSVSGGLNSSNPEDQWRIESLRTPEDNPQTLGSRFTSVFAQGTSLPSTKKWVKGEISNFHYLMLVNTMAGRTFNDLTQYPVFPWVLADYTSEELDLTNPKSFRDLSKPMGCQTQERQAEFRERYQSFAEMGDHNAPPFHYGTHYSSAMIVTSYLIRLQPFVQSYLLLQGGSFDHPDRLFYSLEKTWTSASRDNMTDVRELIPEFYYLPEMLVNANGYDFGSRQGDGGRVDNVALPPWAKGDPKIFIAKHREALESEHVSNHLHQWIDLVFGHKQRGEAALEATNVFHHLSYRGARNLDEIDDPVERMATIGIIHNFGQTPNQVFQRLHTPREDRRSHARRLDTLADTLTRLPFPLLESSDRVSSLLYAQKLDRLFCSGPFRLNMAPNFDRYMEWGFVDGSVRFFTTEGNKLVGLFEHVHQGQISAACFADSRMLITAGTDCTVSAWTIINSSKPVDLAPKGCLFGHSAPVTTLATSRSFGTLLSASSNGQVLLWDLNRLDLIRTIPFGHEVECAKINDVTGTIMLCYGQTVALYTLNGELLLEQHACIEGDDSVTSCAFYEGQGHEYIEQNLVFTGHKRGAINIWNMTTHKRNFMLEHVKRLIHTDSAGYHLNSTISSILPLAHAVYTGDDDGRVYEWDCIQRQDGR